MGYSPNNPLVPGDPYSYDLGWIVEKLKEAIALYQPLNSKFDNLYDYVHDYFEGSDFEALVDAGLQKLVDDGTIGTIIQTEFDAYKPQLEALVDALDVKLNTYDPDSFTGTDTQKLQAAFDACLNGGIIYIRRKYDFDEISIKHPYETNQRVIVQGASPTAELCCTGLYGFSGITTSSGGVLFRDLKITSIDPLYTTHSLLKPGTLNIDTLVNMIFENCYISHVKNIFAGANYCQSLWFINCTIRDINEAIINSGGYQWYNVNILNCIIEDVLIIGSISYPEAVNIKNCVIEGNKAVYPVIVLAKDAYSCSIEGNYFESNPAGDIYLGNIDGTNRNVRICGNFFAHNGSAAIALPTTAAVSPSGAINISNNQYLGDTCLVTGTAGQDYRNEVFCAFNSGVVTDLPATALKVTTPANI